MSERPPKSPPKRPGGGRESPAHHPLAFVDELEVEIEKLVAGGDGLARYEGLPLFVPRAVPGDRVRVRVVERRVGYGRAEILAVLRPGPGRRRPPCPHFERCGGCDLQQIDDELQVELKTAATLETLRHIGGLDAAIEPRVVAGPAWGYRLRARLQVEGGEAGPRLGYFERRSRRLVEVGACPVLVPELEAKLPELAAKLPRPAPRRLDLAAGDGGKVAVAPALTGLPRGEVAIEVGEFRLGFDATCFFQAHRYLLRELAEAAVGEWGGGRAYDLYAGVGLFSLPLARRYARVEAVEGDRNAARHARNNARRNGVENLEVAAMAVESFVRRLPARPERVVVDPPSAGLSLAVRAGLVQSLPRRLTYVSCHAATLARDLKRLLQLYRLESLTLLDLFPQTGHMEAVAQLVAK